MRSASPGPKVRRRHLKYALRAEHAGIQFEYGPQFDSVIEQLVRDHIVGMSADWTMAPQAGAIAATRDDSVLGGLIFGLAAFDDDFLAVVQHLVVAPKSRGQGIGSLLLGVAPQLTEKHTKGRPTWWIGQCEDKAAGYYQAAGFSVLAPREPLNLPVGRDALVTNANNHYNCWFYAQRSGLSSVKPRS